MKKTCVDKIQEAYNGKNKKLYKLNLQLTIPNNGSLKHIQIWPQDSKILLSKSQTKTLLEFYIGTQKENVEFKSIINNPEEIFNWSGTGVGDKAKDAKDLGGLAVLISYLGVGFGSVKLASVAIVLSGLFHIFKKFNYINTNYGPHMKHLVQALNGGDFIKDYGSGKWYSYHIYKTSVLNSSESDHYFCLWTLKSKLPRIFLILFLRISRSFMKRKMNSWRK